MDKNPHIKDESHNSEEPMTDNSIHEQLVKKAFELNSPNPFSGPPITDVSNQSPELPGGQVKAPSSVDTGIGAMNVEALNPLLDAIQQARQSGDNDNLQEALKNLKQYQDAEATKKV